MTTLQDALGADPSFPWIPAMVKDIEGKWYCSMTKEDIEIYWRINTRTMYELSDSDDYYIMRG